MGKSCIDKESRNPNYPNPEQATSETPFRNSAHPIGGPAEKCRNPNDQPNRKTDPWDIRNNDPPQPPQESTTGRLHALNPPPMHPANKPCIQDIPHFESVQKGKRGKNGESTKRDSGAPPPKNIQKPHKNALNNEKHAKIQ